MPRRLWKGSFKTGTGTKMMTFFWVLAPCRCQSFEKDTAFIFRAAEKLEQSTSFYSAKTQNNIIIPIAVRNSNTAGLIHKKKIWTTALYGTDN
jgi:hypothetical protein